MKNKYLECGQITRAHGINGSMLINHFCDNAEVFMALKTIYFKEGNEYKAVKVKKSAPYKNSVIVSLEGITTPEQVVNIRMKTIYADRDDIITDENDFFIVDLIGLEVRDANTDELYGTLKDVINQGCTDIYVISRENKPDAYVPVVEEFVKEVSLESGVKIIPIEGLID